MNLIDRLPGYYQDSAPVSELQRVLGKAAGQLLDDKEDMLAQLWVQTATWGLDRWESWCGLATDRTKPYAWRRQRVLAKLRGQGTTTAEVIAGVVASFGFDPAQVAVQERPGEYRFEVVISGLTSAPDAPEQMKAAVNEIKPGHLDWHFVFELKPMRAELYSPGGLWKIRELTLPAV